MFHSIVTCRTYIYIEPVYSYFLEIDKNAPSTITQEEKRTLERELARVKVSANRVATVIANEWKDENDKVMPVKQWLEERRLMQVFLVHSLLFIQFLIQI